MANPSSPSDTDAGARRPVKPKPAKPRAVGPGSPKPAPSGRRRRVRPGRAGRASSKQPRAAKPVPAKPVSPKPVPPKAVSPKAVPPKAGRAKPAPAKSASAKASPAKPKAVKPKGVKPKQRAKVVAPSSAFAPELEPSGRDPLIGKTIGRCKIEALIGMGKTALVYRAHYEALDDVVAVKILRSDVAMNPTLVERFQSEARAIARVDNENVLKIYDVGKERGLYYMVVELLEGEEVFEVIQREEQVGVMDSLRIIRQAANGLRAAHAQGIVHRDVKPQNLFLLEDGTVKVVDFGLATGFEESSERVGTPHYMAPEVCEHGSAESASDIYGLGITLYHLLVGQPPYAGKDIQAILRAHMDGRPLRPRQRRPNLPKDIGEVVRHLTKRDPLMRPTAAALVEELDQYGGRELKEKESLKRRVRTGRARAAVARRGRKGRKSVAPILGAIAVAVVGVLIFALREHGDEGGRSDAGMQRTARDAGDEPVSLNPNRGYEPPPSVPDEPVETAEEKEAREKRLRHAEREKDAKEAMTQAEEWARQNWHSPEDTNSVLAEYKRVITRFRDTAGAAMAKARIEKIKKGEEHPHPDRHVTTAARLAAVKAQWQGEKAKILERIEAFDYRAARDLVPEPVSDKSGSFQKELDFWREHTTNLVAYPKALIAAVNAMAVADRTLMTPKGEGTVWRLDEHEFEVEVDRKRYKFTWAQIGAQAIADLGLAALDPEKENGKLLLLQLGFAFAHHLERGFWDAKMTLETTPGASVWRHMIDAYKDRRK